MTVLPSTTGNKNIRAWRRLCEYGSTRTTPVAENTTREAVPSENTNLGAQEGAFTTGKDSEQDYYMAQ